MGAIKILTLVCALVCFCSAADWIDMHEKLKGLIIHFESRRKDHEKYWVVKSDFHDAEGKLYSGLTQHSDDDILSEENGKWLAKDCGDGYLCFTCIIAEGGQLIWKNRYVVASYPQGSGREMALLAEDYSPELHDESKHKVFCETEEMLKCRIYSKRWPTYRFTNTWLEVPNGPGGYYVTFDDLFDEANFRIYAPQPTDYYKTIYEATNEGSEPTPPYKSKVTIGMSSTTTETHTVTESTTLEVSASFSKASTSASQTISSSWETSTKETFWAKFEKTMEFITQPRTRLTVKQLMGRYGIFSISSENYVYEEEDLDNPNNSYKSGVMTMNRDSNKLDVTSHRSSTTGQKKEL